MVGKRVSGLSVFFSVFCVFVCLGSCHLLALFSCDLCDSWLGFGRGNHEANVGNPAFCAFIFVSFSWLVCFVSSLSLDCSNLIDTDEDNHETHQPHTITRNNRKRERAFHPYKYTKHTKKTRRRRTGC